MTRGWSRHDRSLLSPSLVSVACSPRRRMEHRRRPSCDYRHPPSILRIQAACLWNGNRNRTTTSIPPRVRCRPPLFGVSHWITSAHHLHPWDRWPASIVHAGSANAIHWPGPLSRLRCGPSSAASMLLPRWWGTLRVHPRLSPSKIQMAPFPSP
jgi:hypothetical protein